MTSRNHNLAFIIGSVTAVFDCSHEETPRQTQAKVQYNTDTSSFLQSGRQTQSDTPRDRHLYRGSLTQAALPPFSAPAAKFNFGKVVSDLGSFQKLPRKICGCKNFG